MADDSVTPAPSNGPTSWRDVYALVQDSERRLTQTLTDGFARQPGISSDHEARLRMAEASIATFHGLVQTGTKQQEDILRDWNGWRAGITKDVEAIQQSDIIAEARRGGILAVGNKAKAALLVAVGIVGPAITTFILRVILPPT